MLTVGKLGRIADSPDKRHVAHVPPLASAPRAALLLRKPPEFRFLAYTVVPVVLNSVLATKTLG